MAAATAAATAAVAEEINRQGPPGRDVHAGIPLRPPPIGGLHLSLAQAVLAAILVATVGLFLHGGWRHAMVAMISLLPSVATGLVPPTGESTP